MKKEKAEEGGVKALNFFHCSQCRQQIILFFETPFLHEKTVQKSLKQVGAPTVPSAVI
jgi:hypothetical protein